MMSTEAIRGPYERDRRRDWEENLAIPRPRRSIRDFTTIILMLLLLTNLFVTLGDIRNSSHRPRVHTYISHQTVSTKLRLLTLCKQNEVATNNKT
jgi:hypothetical protein